MKKIIYVLALMLCFSYAYAHPMDKPCADQDGKDCTEMTRPEKEKRKTPKDGMNAERPTKEKMGKGERDSTMKNMHKDKDSGKNRSFNKGGHKDRKPPKPRHDKKPQKNNDEMLPPDFEGDF